jgi:hypothetical protein
MHSNTFRQLLILGLVGVVIIVVLIYVGVFKSTRINDHEVTFRLGGTTSTAVVTYTQENGSTSDPFEASVPWQKVMKFPKASVVILTAGNPTQTGSIECQLLLDGNPWKKDTTHAPGDKVSCAGIVP